MGACPAIIHQPGLRFARLALCIRGTLGKGTLHMYPSFRVPTGRNVIVVAIVIVLVNNRKRAKQDDAIA